MESVGLPRGAAQVLKTALQNSGPEAAAKTPGARREAKSTSTKELAGAAPRDANAGGGVSQPTPGHGLGQRVDIKV